MPEDNTSVQRQKKTKENAYIGWIDAALFNYVVVVVQRVGFSVDQRTTTFTGW